MNEAMRKELYMRLIAEAGSKFRGTGADADDIWAASCRRAWELAGIAIAVFEASEFEKKMEK